jgi:hypothetical protein
MVAVCAAGAAQAQDPKSLGAFNDWTAYSAGGRGALICYVYSEPKDTAPDNIKRGSVYVQVAHRQKDKVTNELSVTSGYPYKKDSEAEIEIDGAKFELFTKDEGAWARDDKTEDAVVKAMRAGKRMIVRGTSTRGTKTADTYSLAGFGAAINAINTACGIKPPVS